jgi:hypothetical protein
MYMKEYSYMAMPSWQHWQSLGAMQTENRATYLLPKILINITVNWLYSQRITGSKTLNLMFTTVQIINHNCN